MVLMVIGVLPGHKGRIGHHDHTHFIGQTLLTSEDPVLAPSTGRDRPIHRMWADSPTYVVGNSAHAPRVAGNASQRTPETQQSAQRWRPNSSSGTSTPSMRPFRTRQPPGKNSDNRRK